MNAIPIRILLVDDHLILREGLRALLNSEEDLQVVAETGQGREAIQMAVQYQPDIAVIDLSLPDISGIEVIREIRKTSPQCRLVVLSMHTQREFVLQAIEAGCDGYVPKSTAHLGLLQAIRVVHSGERFLHPRISSALVDSMTRRRSEADQFAALSEREQAVLRLSVEGFNSREIGEKLSLSSKTVETYRQRAMEKLNLDHRSDLVQFALRAGILEAPSSD
jgi:two-component system response regulator NreC